MNRPVRISLGVLPFLVFCTAVYAVFIEPNWVEVERVDMHNSPLSFSLKGLRIVHLSDIEIVRIGHREKVLISTLYQLEADIVFLTGDYVDSGFSPGAVIWFFSNLKARIGAWAVLGNRDYQSSGFTKLLESEEFKSVCKRNRIRFLRNSWDKMALSDGGRDSKTGRESQTKTESLEMDSAYVVGIDDPITQRADVKKAFRGVPIPALTIALVHSPNTWEKMLPYKPSLTLAGHTHGGQVLFFYPFLRAILSRITYDVVYLRGLFVSDGMALYVNRGLGSSSNFPARLGCRPEITVLQFGNMGL